MKKIVKRLEAVEGMIILNDKVIIDVGCGAGELVREMTGLGARVTGIDTEEMLAKGKVHPRVGEEQYLPGSAVKLPIPDSHADMVTFFASFHHVPLQEMDQALSETSRGLKPGGLAVFLEPVLQQGSYFELTGLVEDEREIQKHAYEKIKNAAAFGLIETDEKMVYFERSLENYKDLLNLFVDDPAQREKYMAQAVEKTRLFAHQVGVDIKDYLYKSICRLNVLIKKN
ncbi:MAG: class I SAM-dependent methyltransferase [Acidobacteria bacterium]|nr:class I SAM-dependent methyltransferase [Acidobacteriota bacterium]